MPESVGDSEKWIDLAELLARFVPAHPQPWGWADEEEDILARVCICCGQVGHYIYQLEAHLRSNGLTEGVCIDFDQCLVRDGHHRIVAARRVGIARIPLESPEEATERWIRDEGFVDWHDRKHGDRSAWEIELRRKGLAGAPLSVYGIPPVVMGPPRPRFRSTLWSRSPWNDLIQANNFTSPAIREGTEYAARRAAWDESPEGQREQAEDHFWRTWIGGGEG